MKLDYDDSTQMINFFVKEGVLPRYFYKFISFDRFIQILDTTKIMFSKPSSFNDPFDCNLTVDTNNTVDEINAYIQGLVKKHNYDKNHEDLLKKTFLNPDTLFKITNDSIKLVKENFGISCFSSAFDNLLMWAHYADSHRGACLMFDILSDPDFFMTPFPVLYEEQYPIFNYIKQKEWTAKFVLETKSKDWGYEEEIRILKNSPGLYDFKKDSLIEIILGCNCSLDNIALTKDKLDSKGFKNTIIKLAKTKKWEFKLDFEPYIQ